MIHAILGRGKSLEKWDMPVRPQFDKIFLVNNCSEEVRRLGIERGDAGSIEHVCGRKGATILEQDTYTKLNISKVHVNSLGYDNICNIKRMTQRIPANVLTRTRPGPMRDRGYPPIGWKKIARGVSEAAWKSNNGNCWPTTGLYAIDFVLTMERPDELWLFGFDFYHEQYLIKPNREYQNGKNPKVKMMPVYLQKLVDEYRGTKFVSATDLGIKGDNWHVL